MGSAQTQPASMPGRPSHGGPPSGRAGGMGMGMHAMSAQMSNLNIGNGGPKRMGPPSTASRPPPGMSASSRRPKPGLTLGKLMSDSGGAGGAGGNPSPVGAGVGGAGLGPGRPQSIGQPPRRPQSAGTPFSNFSSIVYVPFPFSLSFCSSLFCRVAVFTLADTKEPPRIR